MRSPKSSSMSPGDRPEKSTLSKTLRLTATIAALGASLGVSVENLIAAETAPKSEAGGIEAVQSKHAPIPIPEVVAPMPAAVQSKDGLPTPAAVQHKEYINKPPPSQVGTQSPVLTPKKIEKNPLAPREIQEETQAPAPAVLKPELRSPLDEK